MKLHIKGNTGNKAKKLLHTLTSPLQSWCSNTFGGECKWLGSAFTVALANEAAQTTYAYIIGKLDDENCILKAALAIKQEKIATYAHFSTTELVFKYFWRQVYVAQTVELHSSIKLILAHPVLNNIDTCICPGDFPQKDVRTKLSNVICMC